MPSRTHIEPFFDRGTSTVSYVVSDIATKQAAVIDPVLDYDFKSGHTDTNAADALLVYVKAQERTVNGFWRRTPMPTICRVRAPSQEPAGGGLP